MVSAPRPWHALPPDAVVAALHGHATQGLAEADAAQRLAQHGPNAITEAPPPAPWRRVARQFASPLVLILGVAALLALALGHAADALVIAVVVVLNAAVGALQEGRAERSMAALRRLAALQVRVCRGGAERLLPARELVPGDLVLLAAGDAVAADARVLWAHQLQVAEAALTGESVPVAKTEAAVAEAAPLADRHGMVHGGTQVTAGRAGVLVVATGAHTEVGRIAGLTQAAQEPATPLERRIATFGRALVAAALVLFALVLALGLWRGLPLAEVLMVAISQMVSMVPEGLPVAVTIALAVGMQRMAARGAIVRRLAAVETLGSTTVVCSDKTGTLTRNRMQVVAAWLPGAGPLALNEAVPQPPPPALAPLLHAAVLCNDAQTERAGAKPLGDPTETALLTLAQRAGLAPQALREAQPRLAELPFDSAAQLMATANAGPGGAAPTVWIKGSPEAVLRLCPPGPQADAARDAAEALAGQALRVLGFACIPGATLAPDGGFAALAGRAQLLGLLGQIDPPRPEAAAAVAQCRAAGVRVVMVTGDHKHTGLAIARQLGLAAEGQRALDGSELDAIGEPELHALLPQVAVFARVHPAQKLRIVQALQARGEVVAMTGDGVNDAPALARADVGVAMGITGTEVAKGAARIVLTDDNFATLVAAVEQGRVVYANLRKVILFLFATSVDEVVLLLAALLAGLPLPLAAVQILWINIVTEGTLTVNLVLDPAEGHEMQQPPLPAAAPLVDRAMLGRVVLMAASTVAATLGWLLWRHGQGVPQALLQTEVFTLLAMCQWFNVLNCQSERASALGLRLLKNRWLLGGLGLSVALQALVLWWPPLAALLHTQAPAPGTLALLAALASSVLWVEELRKAVARWAAPA